MGAFGRRAVAAAAAGEEGHPVARFQLDIGLLEDPFLTAVGAVDHRLIHGPLKSTVQAPGRIIGTVKIDVRHRSLQATIADFHAQAAPVLSGASGIRPQFVAFNDKRVIHFLHFDRRVADIALADRHGGAFPVAVGPAAPAATHDIHQ